MGDVVNLRLHRKRKERDRREASAAENRTKFGRTKAEKALDAAERERGRRTLDGHRLDSGETNEDGSAP